MFLTDLISRAVRVWRNVYLVGERWHRAGTPLHEWAPYTPLISRRLIDGTMDGGSLMRRWVNGGWQYRQETSAEGHDRLTDQAW